MKCNVGGIDRTLRIVVGIILIALAVSGVLGWWAYLGIIPLATGIFRFCPAYRLIGVQTCATESSKDA